MMEFVLLLLFRPAAEGDSMAALVQKIAASGRAVEIAVPPAERLASTIRIAPGPPPLLGFRKIEGQLRHRFGGLDLVVDDAGH